MYPATVLPFDLSCDAPFMVLFAIQQIVSQFTQSEAKGRTLVHSIILFNK